MTDTRTTILKTARRLFVQQGFTATSMRQLAQEVGIGKATIYHHFSDKQAIVMTLLEQELDIDAGVLATLMAEPDPRQRIAAAVSTSLVLFQQSADLVQVVHRELPTGRAYVDARFHTYWNAHTSLVAAAIEQGQAAGIFRTIDPQQAAQLLVTMIFGLVNASMALKQPIPTTDVATANLLDIFYHGINS